MGQRGALFPTRRRLKLLLLLACEQLLLSPSESTAQSVPKSLHTGGSFPHSNLDWANDRMAVPGIITPISYLAL